MIGQVAQTMQRKAAIVGCGRIGAPLLAWMHKKAKANGDVVYGLETNEELRLKLIDGNTGWFEEGMDEYYQQNNVVVMNPTGLHEGVDHWVNCQFAIVCLGSPVVDQQPQLDAIYKVIESIPKDVLVILWSTVPVGTCRKLEKLYDRQIIFAPERILTGNSMKELDLLQQVIGMSNLRLENSEKFRFFCDFFLGHTTFVTQDEAELAKIGNNIIRYIEFTAGTQFARACEAVGADWHNVRKAMTNKYPRGRMCFPAFTSSYCLNKDFYMLPQDAIPHLSLAAEGFNQNHFVNELLDKAFTMHQGDKTRDTTVGILGWTYRPGSDDDRDTIVEYILPAVEKRLYGQSRVAIFDPVKMPTRQDILSRTGFQKGISLCSGSFELCKAADIIIVANAHDEFASIPFDVLEGKVVIDPAGIINPTDKFVMRWCE